MRRVTFYLDFISPYTWLALMRARALGLRVVGPPEHPFRSIEALRTLTLYRDDPRALGLAVGLADAAWGEGRSLTDLEVLEVVVASAGFDSDELANRISAAEVKDALRRSTQEALHRGVFGVPTFAIDDELFWGHDRMEPLARRIAGGPPPTERIAERMIARPSGAERRARKPKS